MVFTRTQLVSSHDGLTIMSYVIMHFDKMVPEKLAPDGSCPFIGGSLTHMF